MEFGGVRLRREYTPEELSEESPEKSSENTKSAKTLRYQLQNLDSEKLSNLAKDVNVKVSSGQSSENMRDSLTAAYDPESDTINGINFRDNLEEYLTDYFQSTFEDVLSEYEESSLEDLIPNLGGVVDSSVDPVTNLRELYVNGNINKNDLLEELDMTVSPVKDTSASASTSTSTSASAPTSTTTVQAPIRTMVTPTPVVPPKQKYTGQTMDDIKPLQAISEPKVEKPKTEKTKEEMKPQGGKYTEDELKAMTVVKLKDLLKANGLKIPKLKADMIKSLLEKGTKDILSGGESLITPPRVKILPLSDANIPREITAQPSISTLPTLTPLGMLSPRTARLASERPPLPKISQREEPSAGKQISIPQESFTAAPLSVTQPTASKLGSNFYTEPELKLLTVVKLKDILKANSLKIPKLKADMIKLILEKNARKNGKPEEKPEPITTPQPPTPEFKPPTPFKIPIPESIPVTPQPNVYTEPGLKAMTVPKLKEILKENGLKIPKLKADMIKSILESQSKFEERPITPESEPVTPEPVTPEPVTPESEPITPESETVTPEPVTPESEDSNLYTEPELKAMTVVKLKEILKENGLKIPKLKADMIKSILESGVRKDGKYEERPPTPESEKKTLSQRRRT